MATTREQADVYTYANRRMSTSLLRGTDEARLDQRRRVNRSLGGGVAVGILIMAGFGIAGWLGGGNGPDLPTSGAVVVGDSGDPYVIVDGVAHRALNLASALLVAGGELTEVRQSPLDEARRGLPVGIQGAPDALSDADDLVDEDWTLCKALGVRRPSDPDRALRLRAGLRRGREIRVRGNGGGAGRGRPAVAADGGLAFRDGAGHQRHAGPADGTGAAAPGDHRHRSRGPEIEIPEPGSGDEPDVELPFEARVGDVVQTGDGGTGRQHFVVCPDGLVPVSPLVHILLAGDDGGRPRDQHRRHGQGAAGPRGVGVPLGVRDRAAPPNSPTRRSI
jgi:ESX secretion system ATPase EccB